MISHRCLMMRIFPCGVRVSHFEIIHGQLSHFGTRVRIMKHRLRTAAMPFLLSVLVLCLSKHCMLVQLLREKIAALSIYHVMWQLLLCDSWQRSSCHDTWVNSRNLYTSARIEEGIAIVLTRRIGPTFQEVWLKVNGGQESVLKWIVNIRIPQITALFAIFVSCTCQLSSMSGMLNICSTSIFAW